MNEAMKKDLNQKGFSLIELMIGLVLGLFVTGIVITVFMQSKRNYNQDDEIARLQENGRYALQVMSRDLSLAGFLGNVQIADEISLSGLPTNAPCGIDWHDPSESPLNTPIRIFDTDYPSCTPAISGTQVLVIKHAKGTPSASPGTDKLMLSSNGKNGSLYVSSTTSALPNTQYWEFQVHGYYIADEDNDGIPGLYRKRVVGSGGSLAIAADGELVPGVENFRVTFGLDNNGGDGIADTYTTSPSATDLDIAVSARLDILVRTSNPDFSYENKKTYYVGSTTVYGNNFKEIKDGDDANQGRFYGRVFSTTLQMRNMAFRIQMSNLTP